MDLEVSYRNLDRRAELTEYAKVKLAERIERFVDELAMAQLTLSKEDNEHVARCNLSAGHGVSIRVEHTDDYALTCIDRLIDKLEDQLQHRRRSMVSQDTRRLSRYVPLKKGYGGHH